MTGASTWNRAALLEGQDPVDDLLRGLPLDRRAAGRAVRPAGAGVEQPEVVVDLGDRADRRARVLGRGLLVDRDRGREPLDEVDVGLVHLTEELAGVRRQRLDVPPLALGEDRVERQGRLARPGQPREHDQRVARQVERDVLEVVLAGASDDELICHATSSSYVSRRAPDDVASERASPTAGVAADQCRPWMTSSTRPGRLPTLLPDATQRLVRTVDGLDDAALAAAERPARLDPRARRRPPDPQRRGPRQRADQAGPRAGRRAMYASDEARDGDIDDLAAADRAELRDRFLAGTTLIGDAVERLPDDLWTETFERTPGGRVDPVRPPSPACGCARWRSTTPTWTPATRPGDWSDATSSSHLIGAMVKRAPADTSFRVHADRPGPHLDVRRRPRRVRHDVSGPGRRPGVVADGPGAGEALTPATATCRRGWKPGEHDLHRRRHPRRARRRPRARRT